MLHRWLTYLVEGGVYASIEVYDVDGRITYSMLVLKKEKGELVIHKATQVSELEALKSHISTNIPLFLTINTHSVLTKPVVDIERNSHEAMVNHTFPNLNLEAFYYAMLSEETYPMVSIARMDVVEAVVNSLKEVGLQPMAVQLGLVGLGAVLPHLPSSTIQGSNFSLELAQGSLQKVVPVASAEGSYLLNGLQLQGKHLLGFAHILGHLERRVPLTNLTEFNEKIGFESKNKLLFNTVAKSALLFFLALLLVNFLVFDHYHRKVQDMKTATELNSSQAQQFKALNTSVTEKQARVEVLNRSGNSKATYYLDQLALTVPATVLLDEIQFQPFNKPFREGKSLEIEEGVVQLTGVSSESAAFSKWIALLEEQTWIEAVEILGYDFVTKENSGFTIKIGLAK